MVPPIVFVSSIQAFDSVISLMAVPDCVNSHLKNKASTVPAFLSRVQKLNPEIVFPSAVKGFLLRYQMQNFIQQLQNEYSIANYPELVARIILQILFGLDRNTLSIQFHCGLSTPDFEVQSFDSNCALGVESTQSINNHSTVQSLPGYARATTFPSEIIRMSTSLLNYMAFSSNSQLQQLYASAYDNLIAIRLEDHRNIRSFAQHEITTFNYYYMVCSTSGRTAINELDRGLLLLRKLPASIQSELSTYARKPEHLFQKLL